MDGQVAKAPAILVILCCCLWAASPALASDGQVYKWVDSAGVTHFSDRPPASGGQSVTVSPLPVPVPPDARRQAELRAWVAQVNQRVNETIRRDQEYRLKQQALQAEVAALSRQDTVPQESAYTPAVLPYGWGLPVSRFRRGHWRSGHLHRMHHHRGRRGDYNSRQRSFSLGPTGRSPGSSSLLDTR